ncbi:MAG: phosphoribosylformylglycinamidine synthase subunit PurS, partial [Elioraea sp.]|nr:phosphoribosylformylglycinamidine synthase subunit PurS [Elioraea sp.]
MKARVTVMPKSGVLDPQGKAIGHALASLGFAGVGEVR